MRQKEKKERQRAKTLCLEISDKGIKVADENWGAGHSAGKTMPCLAGYLYPALINSCKVRVR